MYFTNNIKKKIFLQFSHFTIFDPLHIGFELQPYTLVSSWEIILFINNELIEKYLFNFVKILKFSKT